MTATPLAPPSATPARKPRRKRAPAPKATPVLPTVDDLQLEENWLEWRSRIPTPTVVTDLVTTEDARREFLFGARMLRLDKRLRPDGGYGPSPVQLVIADMLNAGHKFNGILEPRRTTKTTAIQAVILGRCAHRDDYLVGWTMAKKDGGQKTGERFRKDIVSHVERLYPDPKTRPFTINTGKGTEHIRWPNGSYFNAYAPGNDAFTSGAYDIAWVDEAQDASPEMGADFMTSIPPTFDGRPQPQMIGSGTAPDYRTGNLLWMLLNMKNAGVLRHGIPDDTDPEELEAWEPDEDHPKARVRELIELFHPGIGFTTRLSDVEENFDAMKATPGAFNTEYLSLPGDEGSGISLIAPPKWTAAGLEMADMDPTPPAVMALALAIHRDGKWASIAAAWRGEGDKRHVALLHHQAGVDRLATTITELTRKHKRRIVYDPGRPTENVEIAPLAAAYPPVAKRPLQRFDIPRAAVLFMKTLNEGNLVHYNQHEMDQAAEIVARRNFGTSSSWAFSIPDEKNKPDEDITPVEAASRALFALADERAPVGVGSMFGGAS